MLLWLVKLHYPRKYYNLSLARLFAGGEHYQPYVRAMTADSARRKMKLAWPGAIIDSVKKIGDAPS
jgi:hypothetical protein